MKKKINIKNETITKDTNHNTFIRTNLLREFFEKLKNDLERPLTF